MIAMSAQIPPVGEARDDYAIFCDLADRLGFGEAFSEGRTPGSGCVISMRSQDRGRRRRALRCPRSMTSGSKVLEYSAGAAANFSADFRADPSAIRSPPSGKIELFSATVAGFGYRECPGHPWWDEQRPPGSDRRRRGRFICFSSQMRARLHSQYDHGSVSRATSSGREPLWMHPSDAQARISAKAAW